MRFLHRTNRGTKIRVPTPAHLQRRRRTPQSPIQLELRSLCLAPRRKTDAAAVLVGSIFTTQLDQNVLSRGGFQLAMVFSSTGSTFTPNSSIQAIARLISSASPSRESETIPTSSVTLACRMLVTTANSLESSQRIGRVMSLGGKINQRRVGELAMCVSLSRTAIHLQ